MWRGVLATTADPLVVVDADLDPFDPAWVAALVAPLLRVRLPSRRHSRTAAARS